MSRIEKELAALGLQLPPVPAPVAAYIPARRSGNNVYTSGQLPTKEGKLVAEGIVGSTVSPEDARKAAEVCCLNALAAIKGVIGDLDKIKTIVKATIYVASAPTFTAHPGIANGASELLMKLFGESGRHARTTIGVAVLPLGAPVEVELLVEVAD
jgi:enamine deaminase RidA (YjgF/YER057c/UK114 family)